MVTLSSLHCHLLFLTNQPCLLVCLMFQDSCWSSSYHIWVPCSRSDYFWGKPKNPAVDLNKYHCQLVSYPHVNRILGFFFFLYFFPPDKHMSVILLGRKKTRMDIVGATSFFFPPKAYKKKSIHTLCLSFPTYSPEAITCNSFSSYGIYLYGYKFFSSCRYYQLA